jgi:general secretion pathway protein D
MLPAIVAGLCLALNPSYCQVSARSTTSDKSASARENIAQPAPEQLPPTQQQSTPVVRNNHSPQPCSGNKAEECGVSKLDLKKARQAYERGRKLIQKDPVAALDALTEAAKLVPRNSAYVTAREMVRQQLVSEHLRRATQLLSQKRTKESSDELRTVLELDPGNQTAANGLREIAAAPLPDGPHFIVPAPENEEFTVHPKPVRQSFHISGDGRVAFTTVTSAFGIRADFDSSFRSYPIRLDLDQADFAEAMESLCALTRSFWSPVSSSELMIAADTPSAHKELDRWQLRTFYLPEVSTAEGLKDVVNVLRTIFEIRYVTQQPASGTVTVRAPAPVMKAATEFLESLAAGHPEVMIDFDAFEVNRTLLQNIGTDLPLQFNVFNVPASALAALGGQNIQNLINQLIASGGINAANNSTIAALLAQLQNQQNSLFSQPVATFGGGKTLMGITVPPATVSFSKNESRMTNLEHVTLRASQGNPATFRLGSRYPILNGTYNTPQIANVIGGTGFGAPFPSFSYEDIGLTISAKPVIHGATDITIEMELQFSSLSGQSLNGVPVLNRRDYKGVISAPDGESVVVAGSVTQNEQRSLHGIPGVGRLPGLTYATSNKNTEHDQNELLIVITPHIVSAGPNGSTRPIRVPVSGL